MKPYSAGQRAWLHIPVSPSTVNLGLTELEGLAVTLVRSSDLGMGTPCWTVSPSLVVKLRVSCLSESGKRLERGRMLRLRAVPTRWLSRRLPNWTTAEIGFLQDRYGDWPTERIAAHLGRGLAATRTQVLKLGLKCRTVWTPALDEVLTLMFPDSAASVVGELIGATPGAVRQRAERLGVQKAPGFTAEHARHSMLARSPFTPAISEVIELLYPDTLTDTIAAFIGMSTERVHAYANAKGWKKSPEFLKATSRARMTDSHPARRFQFQKGHAPANKGVKGWQAGGRAGETKFKKGQVPHTWRPIGTYRVNTDGYVDRKVSDTGYPPRDWVPVHRLVWIAANGPIPPGHLVRFKEGRRTVDLEKITPDALECITRAVHLQRNHWVNLPPELQEISKLKGALRRMVTRRERNQGEAAS
ncbi:MAG: HNH endonuclease signature motif containing protein [Ramlibacter sp.]